MTTSSRGRENAVMTCAASGRLAPPPHETHPGPGPLPGTGACGQMLTGTPKPGTTVRVCDLPGKSSGSCWWCCLELCLVVVPSGACLVASSPDAPGAAEGPARGCREQPARFGYRDADQAHVAGRLLAGADGELAGVAPGSRPVSGCGAGPRPRGAPTGRCPGYRRAGRPAP